jgi:hypothetical protein
VLVNVFKYTFMLLLFISVFSSYYATYALLANAEPSGKIGCQITGTLKVKCCQYHIINRSPSNPAGSLVNYCTDCDVGPGGVKQNCSERYIDSVDTGLEDPKPEPKPPLTEHVPPGVIENSKPITEQNPNSLDKNALQQGFSEQLSSADNSIDDSGGENEQNNNNNAESEENTAENENNENGQNNRNS